MCDCGIRDFTDVICRIACPYVSDINVSGAYWISIEIVRIQICVVFHNQRTDIHCQRAITIVCWRHRRVIDTDRRQSLHGQGPGGLKRRASTIVGDQSGFGDKGQVLSTRAITADHKDWVITIENDISACRDDVQYGACTKQGIHFGIGKGKCGHARAGGDAKTVPCVRAQQDMIVKGKFYDGSKNMWEDNIAHFISLQDVTCKDASTPPCLKDGILTIVRIGILIAGTGCGILHFCSTATTSDRCIDITIFCKDNTFGDFAIGAE